eukprot:CAMPEP_0117436572 /NCGR_PEP_ID=MMETSP0759-20121206/1077_1 /TAXON_ID=63605 /ORGANISM="Percolomonas cosmopolitus, Strain WS" /LENGTH=680 /DNA_ID=CAMNT_0005228177 /DNA_START=28 /DNA_END=2068 /DNA_ORIENTATION=+
MPRDSPYAPKEGLSEDELRVHLTELGTTPEFLKTTLEIFSWGTQKFIENFLKTSPPQQKKEMRKENRKLAKLRKEEHDRLLLAQAAMRKRKEEEKKRAILKLPDKKLVGFLEEVGGKRDRIGFSRSDILKLRDSSDYLSEGEEDVQTKMLTNEEDRALEVVRVKKSKEDIQMDMIVDRVGVHSRDADLSLHEDVKGESITTQQVVDRLKANGSTAPKETPADNKTEETSKTCQDCNKGDSALSQNTNSSCHTQHATDDCVRVEKEKKEKLRRPRKCYCCKQGYDTVHFFYDAMCTKCGDLNYDKRNQLGNLQGRTALVTGARVKIGFHTVLRLLRSNATVIATTRFPKDAARRYSLEKDYEHWKDRLVIYGLDLRHIPSIHNFCAFVREKFGRLDFLINNAAQTLKRKPNFHAHLLPLESTPLKELPEAIQKTVAQDWQMDFGNVMHTALEDISDESNQYRETAEEKQLRLTAPIPNIVAARMRFPNLSTSALMCQVGVIAPADTDPDNHPTGAMDLNGEQLDYSDKNTWIATIDDVDFVEFMEVQTINYTAVWILIKELKPIMKKKLTDPQASYIINVSAMEGKFYRRNKTPYHVHNNSAKAAVNMITRTIGQQYVMDNIFVVSCDTGFNSNELPLKEMLLSPTVPLDEEDGAARILDPIFTGEKYPEKRCHSQFLKDY